MQTYQKTQPNPKTDKQICEAGMQTDRHANKSQNTKSKSKNKQLDLSGHKMFVFKLNDRNIILFCVHVAFEI